MLRRPLEFAARNDYRNVTISDGLGSFLLGVLGRGQALDFLSTQRDGLTAGLEAWSSAGQIERRAIVERWQGWITGLEAQREAKQPASAPPDQAVAPALRKVPEARRSKAPRMLQAPPRKEALDTPLIEIKGVGPRTVDRLAARGLLSVRDILGFLPRRYLSRPAPCPVSEVVPGEAVTVVGWVRSHRGGWARRRRRATFELVVEDETGSVAARFFGLAPRYLAERYPVGSRLVMSGTAAESKGRFEMVHPELEALPDDCDPSEEFFRVQPVYLEVEKLPQKTLRKLVHRVVEEWAELAPDGVPDAIAASHGLPSLAQALREVHSPSADVTMEDLNRRRTPAWRRLIFADLFTFQVGIALRRRSYRSGDAVVMTGECPLLEGLIARLPFSLTAAQERALEEIRRDLARPVPMNRLVQGDVGSGKTVVALAAACVAAAAGHQTALMVPTELLAEQHAATMERLLAPVGLRCELLTGSMRKSARDPVLRGLVSGSVDVVVGTHALIQEGVDFASLGLVVVDEQHRFGVRQRLSLRQKGHQPHVLVMTATPIPRSLSLTLYGDLDVSIIDERPPGRGPVETLVVAEAERDAVYQRVRLQLEAGRQAYLVYPRVEDSGDGGLRSATSMAEELRAGPFAGLEVGLLHGKLPVAEKESAMRRFVSGELCALVATTVIEVGIDVPNATVMVVEHAERFGLAQLHQLRGRVGRGGDGLPSSCFLLTGEGTTPDAHQRLCVLSRSDDGFEIAEEDLIQRGPGEFLGTRQSGLPSFDVADLLRDGDILREARQAAFDLVEMDPELEGHPLARGAVVARWAGKLHLVDVG